MFIWKQWLHDNDDNVLDRLVVSGDQTEILSEGYWPSYNVPFYQEVDNFFVAYYYIHKPCALSSPQKILVWISGNFQWQMEQHFPEFPGKKTTMQSVPKFSPNFSPGISILLDFPEPWISWIFGWMVSNFWNFWSRIFSTKFLYHLLLFICFRNFCLDGKWPFSP